MRWTRFGTAVLAKAVLATVLAAPLAIAGGTFFEAWSKLAPPDGSPQPKAVGVCYVRETSEYDKISIVVESVSEEGTLGVWLGDGEDGLSKVGEMASGTSRRQFLKSTYDEDGLPLGVGSVRDLGGRAIEIRDGEERVVVKGEVPVLEKDPADGGDKPDGGDGGDGGDKPDGGDDGGDKPDGSDDGGDKPTDTLVAKAVFHRTEFAGDRDSRGVVVVTKSADGSSIRFEFAALAPESGYWLSMGAHGEMSLVDDFKTDAKGGAAISRDSATDPGLPLGAESVDDLAGLRVEVRDLDENVVLYTEVPKVATEKDVEPVSEKEQTKDPDTGCDVTVKVKINPDKGREEMTITCKKVPKPDKEGSKDDGSKDDGSKDDGSKDDGSKDDGSKDDGGGDDGTKDDGSGDDSTKDDGTTDGGTKEDGTKDDGAGGDGTKDDVTKDDGTTKSAKRVTRRFAELWIDDGTGTMTPAAESRVRRRRVRLHFTTRGARELPLGVESLRDLAGRAYEIRVGGTRIAGGTLPLF
jgi:hypothetical protein